MADFRVEVVKIASVEAIPGADNIEAVQVGDYRSIVKKGDFKAGDLAVYIPEQAIVPENLLKDIGLEGKLSGAGRNRVKAVKLRGCLSQGIVFRPSDEFLGILINNQEAKSFIAHDYINQELVASFRFNEGDDLSSLLGIVKYDPEVPTHMRGEVGTYYGKTIRYDIENIKGYPNVIGHGEWVEFTEKIHGTFCGISYYPDMDDEELYNRNILVYSKGLGAKGHVFKDNEANKDNLYLKTIKSIEEFLPDRLRNTTYRLEKPIHLLGEIYGQGVQDLNYAEQKPKFRVFDIWSGTPEDGFWFNRVTVEAVCVALGLEYVPVLYRGPMNPVVLQEYTEGSTIAGNGVHMREGVVVTPLVERIFGKNRQRVKFKSINEAYLLRKDKNATEFN